MAGPADVESYGVVFVSGTLKRSTPATDEQQSALAVEGASVALVSGAGCGKTRVLTDRYLGALEGSGPGASALPSVLALTFTEKAARELRERVRRACRERLEAEPGSAYWRDVRRGLEAAPISTFHGFCGGVLRAFPVAAGVEPGFRILEDSLAAVLRRQALDDSVRRRLVLGDVGLRRLIVRTSLSAVREMAAAEMAGAAARDTSRRLDRSREELLAGWRMAFERMALPTAMEALRRGSRMNVRRLKPDVCSDEGMRSYLYEVGRCFRALGREGGPALDALAELLADGRRNSAKFWPSTEEMNGVSRARSELKKLVDKANASLIWDEELAGRMVVESRAICALVGDARELYDQRKRDAGALDFDDLQTRLLELLRRGPAEVVERIRESIRLILVDEFQDTDPTQAEILTLLAGEAAGVGRLFLVGDVKQSIYGFRGAEPGLLGRFRESFPGAGRLQLTRNFRSVPGVIRFVNALFAEEFTGAEDRLAPSRAEPTSTTFAPVTFVRAVGGGGKVKADGRRTEEAAALACLLRTRIDAGWMIHDPEDGRTRAAGPGDIVVLVRAIHTAVYYERALMDAGFETYILGGATFYTQPEVLDLINLLTCLEDPTDEVALAGLLRSGFFAVSDEALYWLSRSPGGTLLDGLRNARQRSDELPAPDRVRVRRAVDLLGRWRLLKDRVTIGDLLDTALDESGYEAALLAQRQGGRMRANCRKLVRVARAFDAFGGLGLADFVERLKEDYDNPPKESQEATTDEQGHAIRIMTIHQSKGLEFPIVVLPNVDREDRPSRETLIHLPEFGPIVKGQRSAKKADGKEPINAIEELVVQTRRNEERAEELRILYVAVTRARDALVLSAGRPIDEARNSPWYPLLLERFDLESGECLGEGEDARPIEVVDFDQVRAAGEPAEVAPGVVAQPRQRDERTRLLRIARDVETAVQAGQAAMVGERLGQEPSSLPRWLELDAGPLESPLELAVHRLLQMVCGSVACYRERVERLPRLVDEAARRQVPAATPRVVAEALARLEAWGAGRLLGEEAVEIQAALEWEVAATAREGTTCRGRTEAAWRGREGGWHLVHVAGSGGSEADELCEWLRAALARSAFAPGQIESSRVVLLGRGGPKVAEITSEVDGAQVLERLRRLIELRRRRGLKLVE